MIDPMIPREILFADPEKTLVKLSPDGKYLSYLGPVDGELNLWLAPAQRPEQAVAITHSADPLRDYHWSTDSSRILYTRDHLGDENWQLCGVEIATGKITEYTPRDRQARILQLSKKIPNEVGIALNLRDIHYYDVYRCNLTTGQLHSIYENDQYWDFWLDQDLELRLALKVNKQSGDLFDMTDLEQPTAIATFSQLDLLNLYFYPKLRMGIANDNRTFYFAQSVKTNTAGLCALDLHTGDISCLGVQAQADICDVLFDPVSKIPQAYAVNYHRKIWYGLTPEAKADIEYLNALDNGDMDFLSVSADGPWMVSFTHDAGPAQFYTYERKHKRANPLFVSNEKFEDQPFTTMHAVDITMRDGLNCVCYLSIPRENDSQHTGIPDKPLPLVFMIHGGPTFRDFWGYNQVHQWLANRGYAVMSVNYRASTGFGKAHVQAGNGEWGGKIQEDIIDAMEWAIINKITTADKVAIMGRSFGGYTTLVGLTSTPELYCCGIDIVGPANLETTLQKFPPYWKAMSQALYDMIGLGCDPKTPEGKEYLAARSPIHHVDQICKPLLIGHGRNDARVMQDESDKVMESMHKNGIPLTYVIFPDEGHHFIHPGNREAFYAVAEMFLAKNLGGRCEPYNVNTHTSMQVKADDFGLLGEKAQKAG